MIYKANNIDTDKALQAIEDSRRYQQEYERFERHGIEKYYMGIRKGLDIAEGLFNCSNYEKTPRKVEVTGESCICPKCNNDLMGCTADEKDPAYCPFCGERLEWPSKE